MTNTFIAIAASLAALIAAPVAASPFADEPTGKEAVVDFADLNLSTEKGRAILDARIRMAVKKVCGSVPISVILGASIRKCHTETMVAAMETRDLAVANYERQAFASRTTELRVAAR